MRPPPARYPPDPTTTPSHKHKQLASSSIQSLVNVVMRVSHSAGVWSRNGYFRLQTPAIWDPHHKVLAAGNSFIQFMKECTMHTKCYPDFFQLYRSVIVCKSIQDCGGALVATTGFCGTCETSASSEECLRAGGKPWANNSLISLSSFDMGPWKMVPTDGEGTLVSWLETSVWGGKS